MDSQAIKIIGVYSVPESPDVKLIEIFANCPASKLEVEEFAQQEDNAPESDWQTAYDEHYLNEDGTEVIGGWDDLPSDTLATRLAFFLCFVNFDKPLLSQFGELPFPVETPLPNRLREIINFEPVD